MMPHLIHQPRLYAAVLLSACLVTLTDLSSATSLTGTIPPPNGAAISPKDTTIKKYVADCRAKPKDAVCEKLRKEAVEILKDDVLTLGSSANREFLPTLLNIFKSDEPELRVAVLDAIGMMGATDADIPMLAKMANDPVPDVRRAAGQAISHGKGNGISLLGQRVVSMKTGLSPDMEPDPAKYAAVVAPNSTYLFYTSDPASGRLSYTSKKEAAGFFKTKAKKGPFKLDEFQKQYRYQLQDEEHAWKHAQDEKSKQLEKIKPDPTNMKAFTEFMEQVQSVQMGQVSRMQMDSYQPTLFKEPTVFVLEERQIGQRNYPTRYVVTYQDLALKQLGYRLVWMTVPDDAINLTQAASLASEKQEHERHVREEEGRKKQEALEQLIKKKDEQEKQKFKKGQSDLEKELGF